MLNKINPAEECEARDDESSNATGNKINTAEIK